MDPHAILSSLTGRQTGQAPRRKKALDWTGQRLAPKLPPGHPMSRLDEQLFGVLLRIHLVNLDGKFKVSQWVSPGRVAHHASAGRGRKPAVPMAWTLVRWDFRKAAEITPDPIRRSPLEQKPSAAAKEEKSHPS